MQTIGSFYGIDGKKLQRYYRNRLSDFKQWKHCQDASKGLIYPENLGPYLSIDETSLSHGELYTIITNKSAKGKKGALVAILEGTHSDTIIPFLQQLPVKERNKVEEVTVDLAGNMNFIVRRCFPNATIVIDRFHVQQLATEALQEIRIKHRWEALDAENDAIENAKKLKQLYSPEILSNGDTLKQLLARSRYLLYKHEQNWTKQQADRATLLFERFPDIKKAYDLTQSLSSIYNTATEKIYAYTRLAKWHEKVEQAGFKAFNTISKTIMNHYKRILNYFDNRSTNASAESFNAKIKAFRQHYRGVTDINFFLFRLSNLYA
jgi:transposase